MKTVFYAWQSDLPNNTNRSFLESCLERAIEHANNSLPRAERLVLDKDTQGVAGMPIISDVVFEKIASCAVFVPDLSIVTPTDAPRAIPNPNVLVELGYALRAIGDRRIAGLLNTAFGAAELLPFDLRSRRHPLTYCLPKGAPPDERTTVRDKLVAQLASALAIAASQAPTEADPIIDPLPAHAIAPIEECSFIPNGAGQIARTNAHDKEGRPSEYVFWHHGPSAWLRVVPVKRKNYSRAELAKVVDEARVNIKPFGDSASKCRVTNTHGEVIIGFDAMEPDAVATRVTQIFRNGEIWGLNKAIAEHQSAEPTRTSQIPWPALAQASEATLQNFLQFANDVLRIEAPVIVVAGLAVLRDAVLVREKTKWYVDPPKQARFLEDTVRRHWIVQDFGADPGKLLAPWYSAIWDACGLDYSTELATRSECE